MKVLSASSTEYRGECPWLFLITAVALHDGPETVLGRGETTGWPDTESGFFVPLQKGLEYTGRSVWNDEPVELFSS